MLSMEMKAYLEDFSRMLREHLGFDLNAIITLENLSEAIKSKFNNFEIIYSNEEKLIIEKDLSCKIYILNNDCKEDKLISLTLLFVHGLLNLTSKQINRKIEIGLGKILNDKNTYFVTLAFLMPINKLFELLKANNGDSKVSIDSSIDIISKTFGIKKHYVYKRCKDLNYLNE